MYKNRKSKIRKAQITHAKVTNNQFISTIEILNQCKTHTRIHEHGLTFESVLNGGHARRLAK